MTSNPTTCLGVLSRQHQGKWWKNIFQCWKHFYYEIRKGLYLYLKQYCKVKSLCNSNENGVNIKMLNVKLWSLTIISVDCCCDLNVRFQNYFKLLHRYITCYIFNRVTSSLYPITFQKYLFQHWWPTETQQQQSLWKFNSRQTSSATCCWQTANGCYLVCTCLIQFQSMQF